jgi:hypothetical protein
MTTKTITLTFDEEDIYYLALLLKIETSRNKPQLSELRKEYKGRIKEIDAGHYLNDGYFDDVYPEFEHDMKISNHILKDIIGPAAIKELGDKTMQQLIKPKW